MNHLVILLSLVALIVWTRQIQQIVNTSAGLLSDLIQAFQKPLEQSMQEFSGWLRRDGVPGALSLITHDAITGLVGFATWADFKVLQKSLALIWPWPESSALLAGATVAMVGLLAYAAHTSKGTVSRAILVFMLALLISFQGILAFIRSAEIQRVESAPVMSPVTLAGQLLTAPSASLTANATAQLPDGNPAGPAGPDLLSILAAAVAVLLSLAQAYGCSRIISGPGGTALAWTLFGPLLGLNGACLGAFRFLQRSNAPSAMAALFNAGLDAAMQVRKAILRVAELCRPATIKESLEKRRRAYAQSEINDVRVQTAQEAVRRIAIHFMARLSTVLDTADPTPEQARKIAAAMEDSIHEYRSMMAEIARDVPPIAAPAPTPNRDVVAAS